MTKYWHSEISDANQYAAYCNWFVLNVCTQKHRQGTCEG